MALDLPGSERAGARANMSKMSGEGEIIDSALARPSCEQQRETRSSGNSLQLRRQHSCISNCSLTPLPSKHFRSGSHVLDVWFCEGFQTPAVTNTPPPTRPASGNLHSKRHWPTEGVAAVVGATVTLHPRPGCPLLYAPTPPIFVLSCAPLPHRSASSVYLCDVDAISTILPALVHP